MPASQRPSMGAIPFSDQNGTGVTFRVWAPGAHSVFLNGTVGGIDHWPKDADPTFLLTKDAHGYWSGFWPGASEGDIPFYRNITLAMFLVGGAAGGVEKMGELFRARTGRVLAVDAQVPHAGRP